MGGVEFQQFAVRQVKMGERVKVKMKMQKRAVKVKMKVEEVEVILKMEEVVVMVILKVAVSLFTNRERAMLSIREHLL